MPRSLQKHHKGMINNTKRARKRAKTGQRRRRFQRIIKTSRKDESRVWFHFLLLVWTKSGKC